MIELFAADTPNGKKISIMLEEIKLPYKVTKVNLSEGEQFKEDFVKISPFSKIPVIKDSDNDKSVFGSGAILIYLADKTQKFYHSKNKTNIDEWLMAQMGLVGPQIGAYHHFYHFNKGKNKCNFNIILPGADFIFGTYKGYVDNSEYCKLKTNKTEKDIQICEAQEKNKPLPYGLKYKFE